LHAATRALREFLVAPILFLGSAVGYATRLRRPWLAGSAALLESNFLCLETRTGGLPSVESERIDSTKKQRYFADVKTVNLTIDEDTWRAARRLAAERDTSVSALVREALEHLTKTSERREEARREIQAMIGSFGGRLGVMPSREERNARR
jgi:hypothetical protein